MIFDDESNKKLYDDLDMTSYEWWNTVWETIDYEWNETNMTSYGENLGVQGYEIVDFYDQNTTVSNFS